MMVASHFGEIMDLLNHGWSEYEIPELREQIDDALRLREAETSASEARTTARVGNLLTVLFGLLAIPPLAEQVVQPLWVWLNLPRPVDEAAFQMLANGVSFSCVAFVVIFLMSQLRYKPCTKVE